MLVGHSAPTVLLRYVATSRQGLLLCSCWTFRRIHSVTFHLIIFLQAMMRAQLQRIADTEGISENVFEIASKSLKD